MADEKKFRAAIERVTRNAERYAERAGLALQPDRAQRDYVLQGLARDLLKYGRAYCPCRKVTGNPEKDRANLCPCRTHRAEIEQSGQCECGLFTKRRENKKNGNGIWNHRWTQIRINF
jgi:ferredoxin-thioredoxin reductase catalytic subunit